MRRTLVAFAAAATLAGSMVATPSDAQAAPPSTQQDGLVNVAVADLVDVTNVNVGAVAQVVATVCPAVDAQNLAVLASGVDQTGSPQTVLCTTSAGQNVPVTITQNNTGGGRGNNNRPPGRVSQDGLVNVYAADLIDVRDVNVAAAAQAIAGVCPGIDVQNVAVLASQVDQTGAPQTVTCTTTGTPITITQNNPGRGR